MAYSRQRPLRSEDLQFFMSEMSDDSESEDDFDGWLAEDDSPHKVYDGNSSNRESNSKLFQRRSLSLDSLDMVVDGTPLSTESTSPLTSSPSRSPGLLTPSPSLSRTQTGTATQHTSTNPNTCRSVVFSARPGVVPNMEGKSPVDFFRLIFKEKVMKLIYTETCRYASQYLDREKEYLDKHPHARAHDWCRTELTVKEIEAFLALLIAMGMCGLPTQRSYWSTSWPFVNENFSSIMSSRRFELIMKFLHLNNSQAQVPRGEPGFDKLFKLRPFLELVLENCKTSYQPYQHISIDESMISYKGRLSFIQYLPKKPHKWGLKAWVLADSRNGYTWEWQLYTGKEDGVAAHGLAHRVVMQLTRDPRLEQKGYIIYTDSFYSSPALFRELREHGFYACGTALRNCKGIPKDVSTSKLERGDTCNSFDDGIMAIKWHDKREVLMLSTIHDNTMVEKSRWSRAVHGGVETIKKPFMVDEYNKHMGGVDRSNQMIMYYGFSHRSLKWWKRVFFHMLDLALVNAYILSLECGNKHTQLAFRKSVAESLLEGFETQRAHRTLLAPELPLRLTEKRPFLELVPHGARPDCRVCSNRRAGQRHQTGCRCKGCKTPLCPYPCMERYHTLKDYKVKY